MPDINVNKLSEALNTKADIDLNNTGVFSTSSGGVNLVQSTPSDAKGKEVTSADFSLKQGGLELMDVVFAPLGIDESKNKRRYLNGQVIIQEQFPAFTAAVKARMSTMANAFTTEVNWQAEKTNSKLGQCGKFVVDDTAGTIRLPCVVNAQGLVDLALIGGIKAESLPNINISSCGSGESNAMYHRVAGYQTSYVARGDGQSGPLTEPFASLTSSTYQDNAPVQQEAIQYPYCIVVNTGVEETDRPINNYQVNNVYSYGMSQYYKGSMNNNSWLKSAGQWNDGTVYTGMYNWLLEQMNNGVSGFLNSVMYAYSPSGSGIVFTLPTLTPKVGMTCYGWTDGSYENIPLSVITSVTGDGSFQTEFQGTNYVFVRNPEKDQATVYPTDYDFVINAVNQTFKLPLLNGEENIPDYSMASALSNTGTITINKNGWVNYTAIRTNQVALVTISGVSYKSGSSATNDNGSMMIPVNKGDTVTGAGGSDTSYFIPAKGNGSLYYYIGDTLQNAQLINVARIEEKLTDINAASRGYVVESYHNGTDWYRIYSDGWIEQGFYDTTNADHVVTLLTPMADTNYVVSIGQSGNGASGSVGRSTWKEKTATKLKINSVTPTDWVIAGYKA